MRTPEELQAAADRRLHSLAPQLDLESFQAVWLLHEAAGVARRHLETEALDRYDLSWTQFQVLWQLWLFGPEEHRELVDAVRLSKGSVTAVTTELESRGLVARSTDDRDRRRVAFQLTRTGVGLMRRLFPVFNQAEATFAEGLAPADKAELARLLRRLLGDASARSSA